MLINIDIILNVVIYFSIKVSLFVESIVHLLRIKQLNPFEMLNLSLKQVNYRKQV